jgi:hypothetical protein
MVPDVQQNTVVVDYYMGRGHLFEQFEARGHPSLGYEVKRFCAFLAFQG